MFTDDGFIDIEACVVDVSGMLLILLILHQIDYGADYTEKDARLKSCVT